MDHPSIQSCQASLITLLRGFVQLQVIRRESVELHPFQQDGTVINGTGVRGSQMQLATPRCTAARTFAFATQYVTLATVTVYHCVL